MLKFLRHITDTKRLRLLYRVTNGQGFKNVARLFTHLRRCAWCEFGNAAVPFFQQQENKHRFETPDIACLAHVPIRDLLLVHHIIIRVNGCKLYPHLKGH